MQRPTTEQVHGSSRARRAASMTVSSALWHVAATKTMLKRNTTQKDLVKCGAAAIPLLLCLCLPAALRAGDPVPVAATNTLPHSDTPSNFLSFRVGEIAPVVALPDFGGTIWNSQEQLGHSATLLLVGPSSPLSSDSATTTKAMTKVGERLKSKSVVPVVVTPFPSSNWLKELGFVVLRANGARDEQKSRSALDASSASLTIVAVDRAGFVRRVEAVRDLAAAANLMLQFGEFTPSLQEGHKAPDFSMTDMKGRVRRLSEVKGRKNLLLTFFPRCFTGGCTQQMISLQRSLPKLTANDTEVWAVSVDPAQGSSGQRAFAAKWGLQFPLIPDTGRNLSILYGAANSPNQLSSRMSVLIDKQGVIRWIDKQINVKTHGEDVLLKLCEMGLHTNVGVAHHGAR